MYKGPSPYKAQKRSRIGMSAGQQFITTFYPMITFPGIAILLTVFAFNVMGDGLRDALDPRLKQ